MRGCAIPERGVERRAVVPQGSSRLLGTVIQAFNPDLTPGNQHGQVLRGLLGPNRKGAGSGARASGRLATVQREVARRQAGVEDRWTESDAAGGSPRRRETGNRRSGSGQQAQGLGDGYAFPAKNSSGWPLIAPTKEGGHRASSKGVVGEVPGLG